MSTVDIVALRERLAAAVRSVVDLSVPVYPSALDSVAVLPAVVLGMPSWKPGPTSCLSAFEVPVAVVVARTGISDESTVAQLDELWPTVLDGLLALVDQQSIDDVTSAVFGQFLIQGQPQPAQILTVKITE